MCNKVPSTDKPLREFCQAASVPGNCMATVLPSTKWLSRRWCAVLHLSLSEQEPAPLSSGLFRSGTHSPGSGTTQRKALFFLLSVCKVKMIIKAIKSQFKLILCYSPGCPLKKSNVKTVPDILRIDQCWPGPGLCFAQHRSLFRPPHGHCGGERENPPESLT